jgi:hypothetical protein
VVDRRQREGEEVGEGQGRWGGKGGSSYQTTFASCVFVKSCSILLVHFGLCPYS